MSTDSLARLGHEDNKQQGVTGVDGDDRQLRAGLHHRDQPVQDVRQLRVRWWRLNMHPLQHPDHRDRERWGSRVQNLFN